MGRKILWLLCLLALPDLGGGAPRTVLVLGDSLSAGYGVAEGQGWVALLEDRLREQHPAYQVVNASISGDTTASALARLPGALQTHRPDIVVVELGGNDGLRGLSLDAMADNLDAIVERAQGAGAAVLLVAVRLPPNYGPVYLERFRQVYEQVARQQQVPLVAQVLAGVADDPTLMQDDGIHPRAAGQAQMLQNIWPKLQPLLDRASAAPASL